jgi:AhpD family alkylhydroperoxidase
MAHYQTSQDLNLIPQLLEAAPVEGKAFLAFDHAAKRSDGHIPAKTREFIALAVALTTQCAYCLDVHTQAAKRLGATREELAELISIAAAVRAGGTMGHGLLALKLFDAAGAS